MDFSYFLFGDYLRETYLILFLLPGLFLLIATSWVLRKKHRRLFESKKILDEEKLLIKKLLWIAVPCYVTFLYLEQAGFIGNLLSMPCYFTFVICMSVIGWLIANRLLFNPADKVLFPGETFNLQDSVNKIFSSADFFSAINTALPTGQRDSDGLDYIPFMLENISRRRDKFSKSSRQFLAATITLSVVFVGIVVAFSYILLNESSIGVYREVTLLKDNVNQLSTAIQGQSNDVSDDKQFPGSLSNAISSLEAQLTKTNNNQDLLSSFNVFRTDGDLSKLLRQLNENKPRLSKIDEKTTRTAILEADEYLAKRKKRAEQLEDTRQRVRDATSRLEGALAKPINTQNEMLKRLILSAVIVTFLLIILKYFRALYQNHHEEMLRAQYQDLMIRKFYVTLRSSGTNSDERKIVLAKFLGDVNDTMPPQSTIETEKSKNVELDVLKEMVSALLKKI